MNIMKALDKDILTKEEKDLFHESSKIWTSACSIPLVERKELLKKCANKLKDELDDPRTGNEYFEKDKPFLNGNLSINDIVAVVCTNKLYISRAISQHTGRNFCQFVNYHRVMYSVDCFRRNPDLKVTELWSMCGFNTIVSYNMAFKLFMGENPSDWCRKERIRIFRRPK